MEVFETGLAGVTRIVPQLFRDAHGEFLDTYSLERYKAAGIDRAFVQDSLSYSRKGVLRGLHFQHPRGQDKLVYVPHGAVFDVAVDIRVGSPGFGRWVGVRLCDRDKAQLYIPRGFAHGFCVLSERALVAYKFTEFYCPEAQGFIRWNDPAIGIEWPVGEPDVSDRDAAAPLLEELDLERLPRFEAGEQ